MYQLEISSNVVSNKSRGFLIRESTPKNRKMSENEVVNKAVNAALLASFFVVIKPINPQLQTLVNSQAIRNKKTFFMSTNSVIENTNKFMKKR